MKHEMKQLSFFLVLLIVLGIAGFLYRNTLEAPTHNTNANNVACQMDAKVCPDGTSVGRSGPSCEFAACQLPNIDIAGANVAFALPAGYKENAAAKGSDTTLLGAFEKTQISASSTQPDTIVLRRYAIPAGKDANSVMLAQTMYESSGNQPKLMTEFTPVIINGKTYQMVVVERFEAVVHVVYYLPRDNDVLRFEALQHDVMNWTDPSLKVRTLPAVAALETMLSTVQTP